MEFKEVLNGSLYAAVVFLLLFKNGPLCLSLVWLEIEMLFNYAPLNYY